MLKRNVEDKAKRLLNQFPVLAIVGARQCGKSTLAKILETDWKYFDLENPTHHQLIHNDPSLFFKDQGDHLIIDETQISPKLFNTLRGVIDLVAEGSFGILPIEVKYNSNTTKKSLTAMINFIDVHNLPYGIILNNCETPSLITPKIIQIPVGCL